MTVAALPYLMAAGGTAMQLRAQSDAASERRQILNQQMDRTEAANRKAADLVQQEAENYSPDARREALTQQEQKALAQSQADLAGAGANVIDTAGGGGNVSADFLKTQADRQISEGTRLVGLAREAAKVRAPSLQGEADSRRRADLAGRLQDNYGANARMAEAAKSDAAAVQPGAYGSIGQMIGNMGAVYLAANPSGGGPDYSLASVEGAKLGEPSGTGYFGNAALGNGAPGSSFWNPKGATIKFGKG